ncbi:uncharacterized protein N7446_009057 [Penicillium canescens]|uniref:Uncharacterized protein n=1 Tax=Penicillium canescens TaxID=5083 RepID=A0AAD6I5U4_PENCN|nr:uncharacterized protein N7446_009057 [Penicillium canescens]KAJ6034309.1 hypothetical protein N7460_008484 [Penicillium canescens]KAJ6053045.1 hypothetical protein N7446_009057 [Penicillium canescens]KAJ6165133.1 hypothetical protein N7485_008377 [Penicillium canescens]
MESHGSLVWSLDIDTCGIWNYDIWLECDCMGRNAISTALQCRPCNVPPKLQQSGFITSDMD